MPKKSARRSVAKQSNVRALHTDVRPWEMDPGSELREHWDQRYVRNVRPKTDTQRTFIEALDNYHMVLAQKILAGLEAGCCPPPFGIEHSRSCLRFPIETLKLAATVGAKVEVLLLEAMRFTAMRTVRNIWIRRDRLERLQLVPLHIEPNIHGFPYRRAVHEHL